MKELIKHGWQSGCDPEGASSCTYQTFSISFFKIVPKTNGKGTKNKPIGYRLSGSCSERDSVVKRADEIVLMLNSGWIPERKSEKFKKLP